MELKQLTYVLEVAKHKNFSKAAEALYVTQPAISQQIRALETELSIKIFERDTHGVTLTSDGERFLIYANKILDSVDELLDTFNQSTAKNKEILNVGVFPFYKSTSFRKLFNAFFASTANVLGNIRIMENFESFHAVTSGDVDFALIKSREENIPENIDYDILETERLMVLVRKDNPNIKGDYIDVRDLGKFPLLTGDTKSHYFVEMREFYEKNGIDFNVALMNTSATDIMMDMVEEGSGIVLMTSHVASDLCNDNIIALPIEPVQPFHLLLIYNKGRKLRGKALQFRNYVISSYEKGIVSKI